MSLKLIIILNIHLHAESIICFIICHFFNEKKILTHLRIFSLPFSSVEHERRHFEECWRLFSKYFICVQQKREMFILRWSLWIWHFKNNNVLQYTLFLQKQTLFISSEVSSSPFYSLNVDLRVFIIEQLVCYFKTPKILDHPNLNILE